MDNKFKNISAGIQSIVVAIAVLVGGFWTLITFNKLQEAEIAKANYERLKKELIDYRVVNVTIESSYYCLESKPGTLLVSTVKLQNVGNQTEIFDWSAQPLTFRKVSFQKGHRLTLGGPHGLRMSDLIPTWRESGVRLKPGATLHRTFVAPVLEPGMYYIHFLARSSSAEQAQATKEDVQGPVGWAEDSYLTVPDDACE